MLLRGMLQAFQSIVDQYARDAICQYRVDVFLQLSSIGSSETKVSLCHVYGWLSSEIGRVLPKNESFEIGQIEVGGRRTDVVRLDTSQMGERFCKLTVARHTIHNEGEFRASGEAPTPATT